jgi:hypothetical protein
LRGGLKSRAHECCHLQNYWDGILVWIGLLSVLAGCSRGPARIPAPDIDPEVAAGKALALYDTNGDTKLDKAELAACPGIRDMLSLYDQDNSGNVEREEIVARLASLLQSRIGLTQLRARVTYRGKPLSGAKVRFDPEPYLGEEIQAAEGTTDAHGSAQMSISPEQLPEQVQNMRLVHCGTFKVRITHPQIKLPPKYNTETTLGYETRLGDPFASFALTAK